MGDTMQWEDFDLRIEADGKQVRCECGAGQAVGPFDADLARTVLETPWTSGAVGPTREIVHVGADGGGNARDPRKTSWASLQETGDRLFRALVSGSVKSLFDRCRGAADGSPGRGLRIRLRLDGAKADVRRWQELPWETLYCRETRTFFALDRRTSVVRFLEVPIPVAPVTARPPLKTLLVAANSASHERLDLAREQRLVREALEGRAGLAMETLEHPELGALRDHLVDGGYHVLHFMGHGELDQATGEGRLFFADRDGKAEPVSSTALAFRLKSVNGLRLVVLNACESAAASCRDGDEPFLGLAHSLVLAGVPAVVAMRCPVADRAAVAFAETFYGRLAAGDPVDAALTEGRLAMQASNPESDEWTIPALFLRVTDGRLLDVERPDRHEPPAPAETEVEIEDIGGEDTVIEGVSDTGRGERGRRRVRIRGVSGKRIVVKGIVDSRDAGNGS